MRDEQANLVWAIEQMTEGGEGRPWPGRERHVAATAEPPQVCGNHRAIALSPAELRAVALVSNAARLTRSVYRRTAL